MYQSKLKNEFIDAFFEAILLLENEEECYRFFEDICTVSELQDIAQRLAVAKMLKGNYTYADIAEKTGASTATISRVKKSLHYGADGYKLIFHKLATKKQDKEES